MSVNNNELLPCPFCGQRAEMQPWKYNHKLDGFIYDFVCLHCGCSFHADYCETEEEAIAKWNTRAERTCKMERDEYGEWHCLECNTTLESWYDSWAPDYCPRCGAKVVE